MQTYFARQPILDQDMRLFGYELLYRGGPHADSSGHPLDEDKATAAVMESFQIRGIDKITGGKKAFVNFSEKLLLDSVAAYFPAESLVVEVLENITPSEEIINALKDLKKLGYKIALDDFTYRPEYKTILKMADIIKIDFLENVFSMHNFYAICAHINLSKCILLAEKVESARIYKKAKDLGCRLFQGYFFARPATMTEHTIGVLHVNALRLMVEVSKKEIDYDTITDIIKTDVGMTYKILKLVNSAYFSLVREINDIRQAVVFLGQNEIRKWISFVMLSNLNEKKPPELVEMSMIRAHFCEIVALHKGYAEEAEAFFLTGLFSLLDALVDAPLPVLVGELMLPELTKEALTDGKGDARLILELITALEWGAWDQVIHLCERLGVESAEMAELYADSLQWSNELHAVDD